MKIIKHLVLCGGGPIGLVEYGALKYLTNNNIINHSTIESIYATSMHLVLHSDSILEIRDSGTVVFDSKR